METGSQKTGKVWGRTHNPRFTKPMHPLGKHIIIDSLDKDGTYIEFDMSRDMRKMVFGVSVEVPHKPVCSL